MSFTSRANWGPVTTPSTIKRLIIFTIVITLLSAAIQTIFDQFNVAPGPQDILSLSWQGMHRWFLWEPLSYLFIQESSPNGLTLSFIISLCFNMYIFWLLGSSLYDLVGKGPFLRLYFISGILAGLIALMMMPVTGNYTRLAGNTSALLAIFTAWSMAFSEAEILLFFLIPIKAKWLVGGVVGSVLLVTLSHWDLTTLCLYVSAICIGYFYAVMAWGWKCPFEFTRSFDGWLIALGMRLRRHLPHWISKGKPTAAKQKGQIIDIQTGKTVDSDDAFVDAMLAKISKHGESSLTWHERRRLNNIAERKSKRP